MVKLSPTQVKQLRQQVLKQVKREVQQQQSQSLHRAVLINLAQEKPSSRLQRSWDIEVKMGKRPSYNLPPQSSVLSVYQRMSGKLLILGTPGGGKTTTLLELARRLGSRAQKDENEPIPVVLNLATWKDNTQSMVEWFTTQLTLKYGVEAEVIRQWVVQKQWVPLLDGLDEIETERHEFCIQAINQWLEGDGSPQHLVVCDSFAAYKNCHTRLKLIAAILLKPLTDNQIQDYLRAARSRELWHSIEHQPQLLKLAKTPLLLSMMTLAYEEILMESWKRLATEEERHFYLFNAFIRRQLTRDLEIKADAPKKEPRWTSEQSRRWLIGLAKQMHPHPTLKMVPHYVHLGGELGLIAFKTRQFPQLHSILCHQSLDDSNEFAIAQLSPAWLHTPAQQRAYLKGLALIEFLVWGLIMGVIMGIIQGVNVGIVAGFLGGFMGVLLIRVGWIEHFMLRLILAQHGEIPWNYQEFLQGAARRLLLKRRGNRYRFIHPILQEHFAKL